MHAPRRPSHPKWTKAFTLIELVVVVLIVGIIAAVAAPKMFDAADRARESSAAQVGSIVREQIDLHYATKGVYPETLDELPFRGTLQNPYDTDNPKFAYVGSASNKLYPTYKTLINRSASWYNKANGRFALRVPAQASDKETLALFNRVNNTAITSLNQIR